MANGQRVAMRVFAEATARSIARSSSLQAAKAVSPLHRCSARGFATTSRVTLDAFDVMYNARSALRQSVPRASAQTTLATRQASAAKHAGLATEANAPPSPTPEITIRPSEPEDPDVYAGGDPSLIVTERAAQHLSKVSTKENNDKLALRVAVEPGGCHGYQYKMELTDEVEDDDFRFSIGDRVHLVIDSTSLRLIKGSTIDYVTELIGSHIVISENPQQKNAGCGCGISWEPMSSDTES